MRTKQKSAFADRKMLGRAIKDSFVKLSPKTQAKNPVMFLVFVSAILTSILWVVSLFGLKDAPSGYTLAIAIILWFTVLFANFAEAIAEGRGKAQADSLRASRKDVDAHKIPSVSQKDSVTVVPSALLKKGELVIVKAGEQIPADGEVIEGAASVDESAITDESAPVIREAGGDRSAVTGGTSVLSDWIVVRVTNEAGESFLDKMIAMVEGAARKKTPNEIALQIFLVALSIIFILVTVSLYTYSIFSAKLAGIENPTSVTTLVALLVCLAPTTIGALLSAIGIAGMSRLNQANVLAMSGRAIEAAGDVDILMLDKTGTITLGNRQASEFIPVDGVDIQELADAAQLSSLADETPEGRSVVVLAKKQFGIRGRSLQDKNMHFVPFTAVTRMSGVDFDGNEIRKGAADAMQSYVTHAGGMYSPDCDRVVKSIASKGGTPLVVAKNHKILGVIYLKDIIKQGVKEKFADLRKMGIKTIMITGDNPITAAAIAAEAGVDDFLAEATPEGKLAMIRDFQAKGHLVAMTGDGTNDAPALAQADVAVAMNSGTQAAKEAGNMVDLDSSPTKLIDIVRIGKQLLMTRGSLTTFSIANDVAKYFAIIPALFMGLYPGLSALNIMGLHSPQSAVLSAIIYNALIIIALIPLALKGVKYREVAAGKLLSRNLLVYGLGGLAAPFTLIGCGFDALGFTESNIIAVYILGVLVTAVITINRLCGILTSVVSVLVFNFFFTTPRLTFHFDDPNYIVTFTIMFIVTLLSGSLATRLKENAKQSAHTAYRTKILFETNQLLQKEQDENAVITATAGQLMKLLKKDIVVYLSDGKELATPNVFRAVNSIQEDLISENEKAVADWAFRNNKHAGATTDTLSSAKCLYLAIRVNQHVYGVAGIAVNGIPLDSFENSVLLSILGECALALENIKNAKEKEEAAVLAQNEQLRANLLRAISHDLRTPLTAISGSADNLLANYKKMDDALREQTFTDIYDDSMWLINLVENLLAVTRIEGGQVNLTRSIELMDEVVSEALKHINRKSKEHTIRVTSGKDFILAHIDAKLIVQVIINLVDNAIKYTPVGSVIEIHTDQKEQWVTVSVSDNGPGIPDEQKPRIFDMFYSGANKVVDSRRSLGLGLSLCKSIVTAHGGTISVSDNQPNGTVFTFTLPAGEVELHE